MNNQFSGNRLIALTLAILSFSICQGQTQIDRNYQVDIKRSTTPIKVDGILDESAWQDAQRIDDFFKSKPIDTLPAESKTIALVTYDKQFLYVAATCFDEIEGAYIIQSLKRDFSFPRSDAFVVFIDPYLDGTNGFSFACNALGAQREGVLEYGGKYGVTTAWDNKWYSAVKNYDDKWVVEMAIPFKTIRFKEGGTEWRINFSRNDQKRNETSTWVPLPFNFNVANLGYTAPLIWDEPVAKTGSNISLIPYATGRLSQQYDPATEDVVFDGGVGFDAKVGVTSSLNLDVTVNPDFSQVEVDRQVTNLDRFEINFPERRQFFLENLDLFGNLGGSGTQPFYTRRIGLGFDTTGKVVETPILAGARLSGKINRNWRVGALNIQTRENEAALAPAQNYSMAILQRRVWNRSAATAFVINRQATGNDSDSSGFNRDDFNRIAGAEFRFLSKDGVWAANTYWHLAFIPTGGNDRLSYGNSVEYDTKKFYAAFNQEYVGNDYRADVGFIRRTAYYRFNPRAYYYLYPSIKWMNYLRFGTGHNKYYDLTFNAIESTTNVSSRLQFINTAWLEVTYNNDFLTLRRDFDPSRSGGLKLKTGNTFYTSNIRINGQSDERKLIFVTGNARFGGYFNGNLTTLGSSIRFRFPPRVNLSLEYEYNEVNLPSPYNSSVFHLFGPQLDVSFTKSWFFTTFVQYNTQADNVNINARLQWRFKPASDLFFVYTDNYFPETFMPKSRAAVIKLTYWFNL